MNIKKKFLIFSIIFSIPFIFCSNLNGMMQEERSERKEADLQDILSLKLYIYMPRHQNAVQKFFLKQKQPCIFYRPKLVEKIFNELKNINNDKNKENEENEYKKKKEQCPLMLPEYYKDFKQKYGGENFFNLIQPYIQSGLIAIEYKNAEKVGASEKILKNIKNFFVNAPFVEQIQAHRTFKSALCIEEILDQIKKDKNEPTCVFFKEQKRMSAYFFEGFSFLGSGLLTTFLLHKNGYDWQTSIGLAFFSTVGGFGGYFLASKKNKENIGLISGGVACALGLSLSFQSNNPLIRSLLAPIGITAGVHTILNAGEGQENDKQRIKEVLQKEQKDIFKFDEKILEDNLTKICESVDNKNTDKFKELLKNIKENKEFHKNIATIKKVSEKLIIEDQENKDQENKKNQNYQSFLENLENVLKEQEKISSNMSNDENLDYKEFALSIFEDKKNQINQEIVDSGLPRILSQEHIPSLYSCGLGIGGLVGGGLSYWISQWGVTNNTELTNVYTTEKAPSVIGHKAIGLIALAGALLFWEGCSQYKKNQINDIVDKIIKKDNIFPCFYKYQTEQNKKDENLARKLVK